MEERNITVDREDGGPMATFSLVAVIVVVALIALFVWQPWNQTSTTRSNSTTGTTQSRGAGSSMTTTHGGSQY